MVDGVEQTIREGSYSIEWYEGTKRIRVAVGKNATEAQTPGWRSRPNCTPRKRDRHSRCPEVDRTGRQHSLAAAIASYLEDIKLSKETEDAFRIFDCLELLRRVLPQEFVEEIDRRDMLKFAAFLRDEKEQSARSCLQQIRKRDGVLKTHGVRRYGMVGQRTTGLGSLRKNRKSTSEKKSRNFWTPANRMNGYGSSSF